MSVVRPAIARQAAFDMNCPENSLNFVELVADHLGNVTAVGVTGCEKRLRYVYVYSTGIPGQWVVNSESGPEKE